MQRFLNALKAQASALDHSNGQPRFGIVASVDPARAAARVTLQPEGVLTGWLPILSGWVGPGWGMACPPSPGDQVLVLAQEGQSESGVIVGRAWSDQARPVAAPVGEFWLVHASGSFVKLCNDGSIRIQGNVTVAGNMTVTGDVTDGGGSLNRLRQHYDAHIHNDPQGGEVSPPTPQD
jgi:phage baseplate assembly protein gpV